jgi:hypothetical protein
LSRWVIFSFNVQTRILFFGVVKNALGTIRQLYSFWASQLGRF